MAEGGGLRGELLMQGWVMHPGKWEKASYPVVGRRNEVKSCTPERRKKQAAQR